MNAIYARLLRATTDDVNQQIAALPECSTGCLNTYATSINCAVGNFTCGCENPPSFLDGKTTATCVRDACSLSNATSAAVNFGKLCRLLGSLSKTSQTSTLPNPTSSATTLSPLSPAVRTTPAALSTSEILSSSSSTSSLSTSALSDTLSLSSSLVSTTLSTSALSESTVQSTSQASTSISSTPLLVASMSATFSSIAIMTPTPSASLLNAGTSSTMSGTTTIIQASSQSGLSYMNKFIIAIVISGVSLAVLVAILIILLRRKKQVQIIEKRIEEPEVRIPPHLRGGGDSVEALTDEEQYTNFQQGESFKDNSNNWSDLKKFALGRRGSNQRMEMLLSSNEMDKSKRTVTQTISERLDENRASFKSWTDSDSHCSMTSEDFRRTTRLKSEWFGPPPPVSPVQPNIKAASAVKIETVSQATTAVYQPEVEDRIISMAPTMMTMGSITSKEIDAVDEAVAAYLKEEYPTKTETSRRSLADFRFSLFSVQAPAPSRQ